MDTRQSPRQHLAAIATLRTDTGSRSVRHGRRSRLSHPEEQLRSRRPCGGCSRDGSRRTAGRRSSPPRSVAQTRKRRLAEEVWYVHSFGWRPTLRSALIERRWQDETHSVPRSVISVVAGNPTSRCNGRAKPSPILPAQNRRRPGAPLNSALYVIDQTLVA